MDETLNRNTLHRMQHRLLRLQGADKWQFKAETEKMQRMSEAEMREYVAASWWIYWNKNSTTIN